MNIGQVELDMIQCEFHIIGTGEAHMLGEMMWYTSCVTVMPDVVGQLLANWRVVNGGLL